MFAAIPLFVLMGEFMSKSGMATDLYRLANYFLRRLPGRLGSVRLAMESAVILRLAERLVVELRNRDPLAERVVLNRRQIAGATLSGAGAVLWRRASGRGGAARRTLRP